MPRVILLLSLLLGACTSQATGHIVSFGQVTRVDGPHVKPLKLLEDSRCPINARCIQAGRVRISALITGGKWRQVRELELGVPIQIADGRLTLESAEPGREAGKITRRRDYRFGFRFEGGL